MARRRTRLITAEPCVKCGEELPAGMTAYYLSGNDGEGYEHYGKCKGEQKADYKADAMKTLGLNEDTVGSINRMVDYLYREERKDFESRGEDEVDGHIFLDVERVKEFMKSLL